MKFRKNIILKNGEECLLKHAEVIDTAEVLRSFNLTHVETDFLLSYPDEKSVTLESERAFIEEQEKSSNSAEICAFLNGKVVGTAGFNPVGEREKVRHRAEVGISVEKAHWGKGVGRALMTACLELVKEAGFLQAELDVVADNVSAISLYKSLGFVEYGRNPKGFASRVSGWQEVVYMRLEL